MVKYSSLCPRRTMVERSKTAVCMAIEYDEQKFTRLALGDGNRAFAMASFLACVLGCAMPSAVTASVPETQGSGITAAPCPDGGDDALDPCCRRDPHPTGGSEKSKYRSISCCPAETALIHSIAWRCLHWFTFTLWC
jgi:hypothetical protein